MFHKGGHGRMFSEVIRGVRHGAGHQSGKEFSRIVGKPGNAAEIRSGGSAAHEAPTSQLPMERSASRVPAGKKNYAVPGKMVPRGKRTPPGQPASRAVPRTQPDSVRLGNFGQPSGHKTMGRDGTGMERAGMPGRTPANMDGKAHPVARHGGKSAPKKHIGMAHVNHGRPWGARTRDLAAQL